MATEGAVEELPQITAVDLTQEKPLNPEEIWATLDPESRMIAKAIALHKVSITVSFLETVVGDILKAEYLKIVPEASEEQIKQEISNKLKNDLLKLIATGVVDWTTPRRVDEKLYAEGSKKFSQQRQSLQDFPKTTYSEDARRSEYEVARKNIRHRSYKEPGYQEKYVSVNRNFLKLALSQPN